METNAKNNMIILDLTDNIEPKTTRQKVTMKLNRDTLTENDLHQITKSCNASFEGIFTLNDTCKEI